MSTGTTTSEFIAPLRFTDQDDGGITAKKLNICWRDGKVSYQFFADKPQIAGVAATDYLLVLRNDNTYAKVPATAIGGGAAGPRGSLWYDGSGAPGTISGQQAGDQYLDISAATAGDVWRYQ